MASILDVCFPPRCASCEGPGWPMCRGCTDQVGVLTPPWCRRCGRPLEEDEAERCEDCPPPPLDRIRAPFLYMGPMARTIKGVKFAGRHAILAHLASAMAAVAGELEADVVTWVPLSPRRRARRGFDQAEVLALASASILGLPARRLLAKRRDAGTQARRRGAERRAAPAGTFRPAAPATGRILLVDDVLTTGATAASCAEALIAGGATTVQVLAAARSLGGPVPRVGAVAAPARVR